MDCMNETMDSVVIRPLRAEETPLLEDFLYEAIWQPDPGRRVSRAVLHAPELRIYVEEFGSRETDCGLVAETDGRVVGAAWSRCLQGFGWTGEAIPELAVALYPDFRGQGIGTRLMQALLAELRSRGFAAVSLSVQQANPAGRLYRRLGFRIVGKHAEEWVMRCELR